MDIYATPNPPGSPLEKLKVPRKTFAGQSESFWRHTLEKHGVPEDLAEKLARAFSRHSEQALLDVESNYRELEHWANIHTHEGGGSISLPPLDAAKTLLATYAAEQHAGRLQATDGAALWQTSSGLWTVRHVAVGPSSGDFYAILHYDSTVPSELRRYDKSTGAETLVGNLPQHSLNGGHLVINEAETVGYYIPGNNAATVWAVRLTDASTVWSRPLEFRAAAGNPPAVLSPDGATLYIGEADAASTAFGYLSKIDTATGGLTRIVDLLARPRTLARSPDGNVLYIGMDTGLASGAVRQYGNSGGPGWTLASTSVISGLAVHPGTGDVYSLRTDSKDGTSLNLYRNRANDGSQLAALIAPGSVDASSSNILASPDGEQMYYRRISVGSHFTRAILPDTLATVWTSVSGYGPSDCKYVA